MSVASLFADLRTQTPLVEPSLLACDFANLEREIRRVEAAGAKSLHLDIMDGHFVPNLSFGIPVVEAIRRETDLTLDVHLMISEPAKYIEPFREAGADLLTIHIEVVPEPQALLEKIRSLGAGAGLTLNPATPVETLRDSLAYCDLVLVMSVMPGFGGQEFEPVALKKLRTLRRWGGEELLLSVDGGVNLETVVDCAAAGADLLIAGSALFSQDDYTAFIRRMNALAKTAKDGRN
jgi:ribulose-phosphate 3-epimerase